MSRVLSDHARQQVAAVKALIEGDVEGPEIRAALAQLVHVERNGAAGEDLAGWSPVDLKAVVAGIEAGEIVGPVPGLLPRSDGPALLYPGQVHSIAGEPECGKGWIALSECARVLLAGERVVYLDFEDAPASVVGRLLALGAPGAAILERFVYVKPEGALPSGGIAALASGPVALAIVDGLSEAYALLGLDYSSNTDVPVFLQRLARPLTASGAAVLQIDHVAKSEGNRGRFAIGAQHKLAGVAVAYGVEAIERPSRQRAGRVKVTIHKDRHGHVRGHATAAGAIALVHIEPEDDGARVRVTVDPPDSTGADGSFRPTKLMERVSRALEETPGMSRRAVRGAVTGKATFVDMAIERLVNEGYVHVEVVGTSRLHHVETPFREGSE